MKTCKEQGPIVCPFTVVIDDREGLPYAFDGIESDAKDGRRPIYVPRRFVRLTTGDYSIEGLEECCCVERKSLEDLYGTLGGSDRRERFAAEHERMAEIKSRGGEAVVVVESTLSDAILNPTSNLNPKTVFRTWVKWRSVYGVEWLFVGERELTEITVYRILETFWNRQQRKELPRNENRQMDSVGCRQVL